MSKTVAPLGRSGERSVSAVVGVGASVSLVGLGVAVGLLLPRTAAAAKASVAWDRARLALAGLLLRFGLGDRLLGAQGMLGDKAEQRNSERGVADATADAAVAEDRFAGGAASPSGCPSSPQSATPGSSTSGSGGSGGSSCTGDAGDGYVSSAKHMAIIMDGNRRFGRAKHGDSLKGHWDGGQTLVDCVKWCIELGVEALTVYAFSTENWARPPDEVALLMGIFVRYAERCEAEAMEHGLVVTVLTTDKDRLPVNVQEAIHRLESRTAGNAVSGGSSGRQKRGFRLNLCVSYGSRGDIALACRSVAASVAAGDVKLADVTEQLVASRLTSAGSTDPDLVIRTSGELRLSNFLLFELAYAELFFLDKYWPELNKADLKEVLTQFDARGRRFGR